MRRPKPSFMAVGSTLPAIRAAGAADQVQDDKQQAKLVAVRSGRWLK